MADLNTPLAASAGAPLAMVDVGALLGARADIVAGHLVLLAPDVDGNLAYSALVDGTSVDVCFAAGDPRARAARELLRALPADAESHARAVAAYRAALEASRQYRAELAKYGGCAPCCAPCVEPAARERVVAACDAAFADFDVGSGPVSE